MAFGPQLRGGGLTSAQAAALALLTTTAADGSMLVWKDGSPSVGADKDPKANSLAAQSGLSGSSLQVGAAVISEDGNTTQIDAVGKVTMNDLEVDLQSIPEAASLSNPLATSGFVEVQKASSGNLTAAECKNTVITNLGQTVNNTLGLPTAAVGLSFVAIVVASGVGTFGFAPPSGKQINLSGTDLTADYKAALATPVKGDQALFFCLETATDVFQWFCVIVQGAWQGVA